MPVLNYSLQVISLLEMTWIKFDIVLIVLLIFGNVQLSQSVLPSGLIHQKGIRDCGLIYGYEHDAGCFMEHLSTGEMIRPCSHHHIYDPLTCGCTKHTPHHYKSNSECEKAQHHGGYILYSSRNNGHTTSSGGSIQHHSGHTTSSIGSIQHHYHQCESNPYYTRILQLVSKSAHCTTLDEVIEDLYMVTLSDSYYHTSCTTKLLTASNHTVQTGDICSCETYHSYFHWSSINDATSGHCKVRDTGYNSLLSKFYNNYIYNSYHSNYRQCVRLAEALPLFAEMSDIHCVQNAIHLLRVSFHNVSSGHKCHCRLQGSIYNCNKTQTIKALSAHSSIDSGRKSHQCPNGSHAKSEAVPITLCGTPEASTWQQGLNVLDNCNRLPKYIAVASFINGLYLGDGKAGVMVSCNATEITVITQQCDGGIQLEHLTKGSQSHYIDMPEIYYTIKLHANPISIFG